MMLNVIRNYVRKGASESGYLFAALSAFCKGSIAQYAGRTHWEHKGKAEVVIYDYTDSAVPIPARMKQRREKGDKNLGIPLI